MLSKKRDRGPLPRNGGFTLVELLIALLVGSVVVTGSLAMLDVVRTSRRTENLRVDLQQNARSAIDMISRDLQQAGQGMDPNPIFGVVATADGGTGQPDTLYILYVEPDTPGHVVRDPDVGLQKSQLKLKISCGDPVDDLQAGNFVYLANGSARGVAHVKQVARNASGASCDGADSGKDLGTVLLNVAPIASEAHGWVFQGNAIGAVALRARAAVYFVDTSEPSGPKLVRSSSYENGRWEQTPIANWIANFQVELLFSDGRRAPEADPGDTDPDNDYEDIETVHLTFEALARRIDKDLKRGAVYRRQYSLSVTPRNLLYTRNM